MNKELLNIPHITTYNTDNYIQSGNSIAKLDIHDKVSWKPPTYLDEFKLLLGLLIYHSVEVS